MTITQPNDYTLKDLKKFKRYLIEAKRKIKGDNSKDSASTGLYMDNKLDPIDQLNASLDRIFNSITTTYIDKDRQLIQSDIRKEYLNLLNVTKSYSSTSANAKLLNEKLDMIIPQEYGIKENKSMYNTINDLF